MMFSGGKVHRKVKLRYTERLNKNFQASLKLSEKADVTPSKQTNQNSQCKTSQSKRKPASHLGKLINELS